MFSISAHHRIFEKKKSQRTRDSVFFFFFLLRACALFELNVPCFSESLLRLRFEHKESQRNKKFSSTRRNISNISCPHQNETRLVLVCLLYVYISITLFVTENCRKGWKHYDYYDFSCLLFIYL